VDKRIRSAAAAFKALRSVLCDFALEGSIRGKAYSVLVLTVLLYGSEVWCLRGASSPSFGASTGGVKSRITLQDIHGASAKQGS
jgi:hypothetical protein